MNQSDPFNNRQLMTLLELMKLSEQKMNNIAFVFDKLKDTPTSLIEFESEVGSSIREYLHSYEDFKRALIASNNESDIKEPKIYDPSDEL